MYIGSHVSFGKEQLLGAAKEAISYGANTFMFYTGAPQNTMRKNINDELTFLAHRYMNDNGIDINKVIAHAPYIVNLANKSDLDKWQFGIDFIKQECKRCEQLGVQYLVLHPGSRVSYSKEEALENIKKALVDILSDDCKTIILLETMALKGTEVGSLEDIAYLLNISNNRLGVCLDTCHLNDAGYDLSDLDYLINDIKNTVSLDKIYCIHLNDSKNIIGSKKDRHENLGFGTIGYSNLLNVFNSKYFKDIPKILETPYIEKKYPPYKFEIEGLKCGKRLNNLNELVNEYYSK